jgi:hypothetical protein
MSKMIKYSDVKHRFSDEFILEILIGRKGYFDSACPSQASWQRGDFVRFFSTFGGSLRGIQQESFA